MNDYNLFKKALKLCDCVDFNSDIFYTDFIFNVLEKGVDLTLYRAGGLSQYNYIIDVVFCKTENTFTCVTTNNTFKFFKLNEFNPLQDI